MPREVYTIIRDSAHSDDPDSMAEMYRRLQLALEINHKCLNRIVSARFLANTVIIEVENKQHYTIADIIEEATLTSTPISKFLLHSIFLDLLGLCTYIFTISDCVLMFAMLLHALNSSNIYLDDYGYVSVSLVCALDCDLPLHGNLRDLRLFYSKQALQQISNIIWEMLSAHIVTEKEKETYYTNASNKAKSFTLVGEEIIEDVALHPERYNLLRNEETRFSLYKDPRINEVQAAVDTFRRLTRDIYGQTTLMQQIVTGSYPTILTTEPIINYGNTRFVARNGHTSLFLAVTKNELQAVAVLRKYEARIRLTSTTTICGHLMNNITALHLAVSLHRHTVVELLAPLEATLQDTLMRFTPLHIAVLIGDLHSIRLLAPYASGLRDKNGWTALVWCAYLDNEAGFYELLSYEANEATLIVALQVALSAKSTICSNFLQNILEYSTSTISTKSI